MQPISGKVSAASVAAAVASLIVTTIAAHVPAGPIPADVLRIAEAMLTAGITFGAGWLAKHTPEPVKEIASTLVSEATE